MLGKRAGLYLLVMLWVSVSVGCLCAQNTVQLDTNALIEVEDLSKSLANALLEFSIAPHYRSDHPESGLVDAVVNYFKENDLQFQPLRDGEALVADAADPGFGHLA